MANTTLTTFTGTMAKFLDEVDASKIGVETQKVTITNAVYTIANLSEIKTEAKNATIVLQAAANPQLAGTATELIDALTDIKYSGAITVSGALTTANDLANVLALTSGKVTADVTSLTAAALVEALEDEKTVNALTVTVDAGAVDASDLKILDAKTSVAVDASLVTVITGTAAELKAVLAAKTITLDTTAVAVTVDGKVSAADLNTITKATGGVVTAEVEGSAAALNAALKEVSANDITVILTGTTATAKDLKELATKTSININASGIETITGNAADVKAALAAVTAAADVNVTITGPVTVAEINAIVTTGVKKATLEGSATELATLTTSNSDLLTLKVTGTTATAIELNTIDAATSVKVNASAVTSITDSAANLKTMYASKTISGLGNEAVTINDVAGASADAVNAILKATTGKVTAIVTAADAESLNEDLKDAKGTDALTLTVSTGTVAASDLKALDAKTSVAVDADVADLVITGNAADVKTVLKAEGITLDKVTTGAVAVEVTGTVSAADANTIAKATDGKVTATVAAGTAASLKAALTDVTATDALKLKVTGTATVADLLALHGKTSIPVDAKSVTAITGTAGEFATLNTTNVDLSSTVALTFTGTIAAADVNAANGLNDIAAQTFGKVTATVEGSATALQALTTASTDAITVKVTGATATAANLITIDKATSVVVDAKAVKTITADAVDVEDVATVLAAKTIAKAADVAVTITPTGVSATEITALEANSVVKLTTGVVTATVADASASYLNSTLKDAKATDALTLTVIGTTATAADLNALDAKTKEVIDVKVAKIEGTLADLNKVFVDLVTSTHFDASTVANVNITDKTVTANDVNKIAAKTNAEVKATVTADSAANLVEALQDATNDTLTLTVNGTTATAANLTLLNATTSVDVTVNATEVTGTFNELKAVYVDATKADFLALGNENIVIDEASTAAADIDTIANATTGKVTATLAAATPISDATVTALTHVNGTTDVISFTAAAATIADATALVALAAKVITADATAFEGVTAITEATANIGTNGAAVVSALNIAGNDVAVSFTDATAISAASADAIADATSGVVTAVVTDGTAAALNAALVDATVGQPVVNAYTLTLTDTLSVKATDLTGLDGKTSVAVVATSVTDITGSSAEVAAVYTAATAGGITLNTDTVHITGTNATVIEVKAINDHATSGLVTVEEIDVIGDFNLFTGLGDLAQITGLKTIDASDTAHSNLTLNFADLFKANDTVADLSAAIAVKLGVGDKLTLDTAGWTHTSGTDGNGTYVHANGTSAYTVTVTGADNAAAVVISA